MGKVDVFPRELQLQKEKFMQCSEGTAVGHETLCSSPLAAFGYVKAG